MLSVARIVYLSEKESPPFRAGENVKDYWKFGF